MKQFCTELAKAAEDERMATQMYRDLAAMAPSRRARAMLLQHSRDEARHYRHDKAMYNYYCRVDYS